ncbi:MAG TPA: UDP-N-acetylglucosamine 2-epimerase (non-hydrolyzing) [Saprospiraceae bacterium]|nr:UDP-N-acetylglucosamine 2-epimerase (non-hydrolyzing) [Saprospiraceae bacterium]
MTIDIIAGARPNFMKIAPIISSIHKAKSNGNDIEYRLIHTGQHYDRKMSGDFFDQLEIPEPDINLGAGSGSQAEQTAAIMTGYEKILLEKKPDICLVVGDVTSTMACAITAQKMHVKVAHVEAGIRSGDWSMPEEINRMVTDSITNYFFTTSETANNNLRKLGIAEEHIFFVGNTMIDTLLHNRHKFIKPEIWDELNLAPENYIVLTLHRPSNVDDGEKLKDLVEELIKNSNELPVIFPAHPRTAKIISGLGLNHPKLCVIEPLSYLEFNYLVERAKVVITDSGGITEETTVMGIPCMTLRDTTERPETINIGTNELIGSNPKGIKQALKKLFEGNWKKGGIPELWDGKSSERIVNALLALNIKHKEYQQ